MTRHPLFLPALVAAVVGTTLLLGAWGAADRNVAAGDRSPSPGSSVPRPAAPTVVPDPKHEIYAYVPYWEMDDGIAAHVAASDVTTLALFSVTHSRSGELATRERGYRRMHGPVGRDLVAAARSRGARVEVVYSSFGYARNQTFFGSRELQDRTIAGLVGLVAELGVDGVNVDVELLRHEDLVAYAGFVARLRAALLAARPDASVSVATGAGHGGAAMALAASGAGADRILLMGYDYHWAGSEPGASAPLGRRDGSERTLAWSLDLYRDLGVPVERTLLGLPLYGMAWPVAGPALGSPAAGRGEAWFPRRNLDVLADPSLVPERDEIEGVEFLALRHGDGWRAVYFDSPETLASKLALADERGLAGAGLWALGYERGLPAYVDLLAAFRAGELDRP